jgi:hypothetical protein
MINRLALSFLWMTSVVVAPVASVAAAAPSHDAKVKQVAAASRDTKGKQVAVPDRQVASSARPALRAPPRLPSTSRHHSKERIYTVTAEMLEAQAKKDAGVTRDRPSFAATASPPPFLGFSPIDDSLVGVGLWRVSKSNRDDPNRANPMRGPKPKTTRAAVVGMQMKF